MGKTFLQLKSMEEARRLLDSFAPPPRREQVTLWEALGRIPAEPIEAPEALPSFNRSLMDGFALRAADAASARETAPVFLDLIGQVQMGKAPQQSVSPGQAMAIPTGAMLPSGADSVVMVEHTRPIGPESIEVCRAVAPGQHVLERGEDLARGTQILPAGRRLTPLDLGALAACGVVTISVHALPRVAILSTGDELVDPEEKPGPAQVRDTNALTLAAQVTQAGGLPLRLGRVADDASALLKATEKAVALADMVLLSGGSSVGVRDHTTTVLDKLSGGKLLLEGIALSPGKPTLLADIGGKPVFGMPGHPISSFVVFHVLVASLLRRMGGAHPPWTPQGIRGRLTENVESAPGRESWLRVRLEESRDGRLVIPVRGGSAVYSSLAHCDALMRLPAGLEGHTAGDEVVVEVLR